MKQLLKMILLTGAFALSTTSFAASDEVQIGPNGKVSISAKGKDVRFVLHDLFTQARKSYVIERSVVAELFLNLEGIEFDEALGIVTRLTNLETRLDNGIYYVSRIGGSAPTPAPALPIRNVTPSGGNDNGGKGRLANTVLNKRITTRLAKTDFRKVIAALAEQTGLKIEVAGDVPTRFVDAYLIDTSLRYGLDVLSEALELKYIFTDRNSILITKR